MKILKEEVAFMLGIIKMKNPFLDWPFWIVTAFWVAYFIALVVF